MNTNHIVNALTKFRIDVEVEAETSIADIPTNLALALADVTEALGLDDEDRLEVLGLTGYAAAYTDPVPYVLNSNVEKLLAKVRATQLPAP